MCRWHPPRVLFLVGIGIALLALLVTPVLAVEKWGPYRGQLVDQATGKGIPGAAILAVWWKNEPNPVQMNRSFFDAIETVTDVEGRFEIPRYPNPPLFSFQIYPAEVIYFAPGYVPTREEITPPDGQAFIVPTVVVMKAIDPRTASLRRTDARPGDVPLDKMKEFTRAVNVERLMRGLSPLPVPGEETKP